MNISIIIPSFMSEKTIARCLDSIIIQSFKDFECLIIDYPVTTKTKKVVDIYALNDKRIKYIKCPNKGAISQREYGIKNASGTFLTFVDSDDCIHPMYCEYLFNALIKSKTDYAICKMKRITNNIEPTLTTAPASKKVYYSVFKKNKYKIIASNSRYFIGPPSCCCMLIRKTIALKALKYYHHGINVKYWEDAIFWSYIIHNSKSIVIINLELYFYITNIYSVTKKDFDNKKYLHDCIVVSNTVKNIFLEGYYQKYYKFYTTYLLFGIITFLLTIDYNCYDIFKKHYLAILKNIKNNKWFNDLVVLNKEYSLAEKIIAFFIKHKHYYFLYLIINRIKKRQLKQ